MGYLAVGTAHTQTNSHITHWPCWEIAHLSAQRAWCLGFHSALTFHKVGAFLKGQEEVELVPLSNCGAGAAGGSEEHPGRSAGHL